MLTIIWHLHFVSCFQTLAINRGEHLKVLSVKINIPDQVKNDFTKYCQQRWIPGDTPQTLRKVLDESINDAYTRLIQPLMIRGFR